MVKVASLFGQLLSHFPSLEFAALVKKHHAERGAKGFTCWTRLVSMLFCQLDKVGSLREICNGVKCCVGKVVHLGIASAPNKSTLAYANEHWPATLYADLFCRSLEHFRDNSGLGQRRRAFRFKNKLLSLDSSTITLCLQLFPWAKFRRSQGWRQGARPARHDHYMSSFVLMSEAKSHDVTAARQIPLNTGSIVARWTAVTTTMPCSAPGLSRGSSLSPASKTTPCTR